MDSPETLGPYRLGELLGRGGMGSVFAGVHVKSGQRVAVKLIAAHVSDEMRFRRRFDTEIETLKRLRHDNIVQIIGYGEEQGQLFYSMELVQGESLQQRVRREKRLDWLTTIDIAIQVCSALKHAHDIGVIHRDLKPANLVLTENDQVKLVDFGIAKIFGSSEQTAVGSVLGTADYMAPEQARNEGITTRTDLYALGSVMYAMLSGRPPFKGKNITEVIEKLKRDEPIPLDAINPDLPEAVVDVVHDLLQKSPADRPPTALAVMNRLKAMKAGLQRELTVDGHQAKTQVKRGSGTGVMLGSADQVPKPANPSAPTKHQPGLAPKDETVIDPSVGATQKREAAAGEDVDFSDSGEPRTHFQTVDHSPAGSKVFASVGSDADNTLARTLSIALMIALLLAGILFVAVSLKPPTADQAYEQVLSSRDSDNFRDAIGRFLSLYPDDRRTLEVREMQASLDSEALARGLRLKRKLDLKALTLQEQAFVEAMDLRSTDASLAKQRFQQWLDVYGFKPDADHPQPDLENDQEHRHIEQFVRLELKVLNRANPIKLIDPRAKQLLQRIESGHDLPAEERRKMLESMIDMYRGEDWSGAVIEKAEQELAEL